MDKQGNPDTPVDTWVTKELCFDEEKYTDHLYIEFVEGVVESECQSCRVLRVHTDATR